MSREFTKKQIKAWIKIINDKCIGSRGCLRNVWIKDGYLTLTNGFILVAYKVNVKYISPNFIPLDTLKTINDKRVSFDFLLNKSINVHDKTFFGSYPEFLELIPRTIDSYKHSVKLNPKILGLLCDCFDESITLEPIVRDDKPLYFTNDYGDFAIVCGMK